MERDLPTLPARRPDAHKGTFGTVCVLGGQAAPPRVMIGGPAFTASAALRTGAGLVVLAVPAPLMVAALTIAPGATGLALPVDRNRALQPSGVATLLDEHGPAFACFAVGPGWGEGVPQQQILVRLLAAGEVPLVIDADALNALAALPEVQADFHAPAILTPHPGEYRRLAAALDLDADPVSAGAREDAAAQLARRLGCVVVLKGAGTVVSDGLTTVVNETGNVALATAGTGDVLTGVIAGLVAQFFAPGVGPGGGRDGTLGLFDCARLGVHLHGRAADAWAERHGESGLLAGDLVDRLPDACADLRRASSRVD